MGLDELAHGKTVAGSPAAVATSHDPVKKAFLRLDIKQLPGRALGVRTLTGQGQLETFGSALNFDATPLPARLHQVADETPKACSETLRSATDCRANGELIGLPADSNLAGQADPLQHRYLIK